MDTNNTLRAQHYDEKNVFRTSEGLWRLVFDLLKNNRFFMRCTDDYKTQKQFKGFCEKWDTNIWYDQDWLHKVELLLLTS